MSNPREVALALSTRATESKVRFPKVWDDARVLQDCGKTLMLFKDENGNFDVDAALNSLIESYGVESTQNSVEHESGSSENKKRKSEETDTATNDNDGDDADSKKKIKVKKTEVVAVESNRPVATAIAEMSSIYFKNGDARKGGVFSKAAKAIRECDMALKNKKDCMKLKGIGKGIAGYIEELLENGSIEKLEHLRAGTA